MNPAAALSIVTATLGIIFAIGFAFIARDPRWRELRWFALLAASAAVFGLTDTPTTTSIHPQLTPWLSRFNLFAAGVHTLTWIPYLAAQDGRRLDRIERVLVCFGGVLLALTLIPGIVLTDRVVTHRVPSLDLSYAIVEIAPFGVIPLGVNLALLAYPLVRLVQRARRGDPSARTQAFALTLLLVTAANDCLAVEAGVPMPFLLDFGFLAIIATFGGTLVKRFVETSRSYELLTAQLETIVAARTQALAEVERDLQRSEKLAAIGQLAAGVAHEVNSPAAAIRSNLQYLCEESIPGGRLPPDGAECLKESLSSINQIVGVAQELIAAGGIATRRQAPGRAFPVLAAVSRALTDPRVSANGGTELVLDVPEDLYALGSALMFEKAVLNLLLNASQAVAKAGRKGRIEVRARRVAQRTRITLSDNGLGIPPDAQTRLFEPFATTEGESQGSGLGLAVSLGLIRAQGGDLSLLSSDASGTTFAVNMAWASGPKPEERRDTGDSESGRVVSAALTDAPAQNC